MQESRTYMHLALSLTMLLFLSACGGNQTDSSSATSSSESGLTDFQLEHGIGPVTEVLTLATIDETLADSGEASFTMKCAACHKPDERYVGPALRGITARRSPAYIMNMILNPDQMIKEDPQAKALFTEYLTPMAYQNVSEEDAAALLDYFRAHDAGASQ